MTLLKVGDKAKISIKWMQELCRGARAEDSSRSKTYCLNELTQFKNDTCVVIVLQPHMYKVVWSNGREDWFFYYKLSAAK